MFHLSTDTALYYINASVKVSTVCCYNKKRYGRLKTVRLGTCFFLSSGDIGSIFCKFISAEMEEVENELYIFYL